MKHRSLLPSLATLLVAALTTFSPSPSTAQYYDAPALTAELLHMDSLLFEDGFNLCLMDVVEGILTEDFEFYHDQNGFQNKAMFMGTFKESLCSTPNRKPIRKLVEGSVEVFPMFNEGIMYGAIQRGEHEFYIREPGKDLYITSAASFTHFWIKEEGGWMLKRVLSFDHHTPRVAYGPQFDANWRAPLFHTDNDIELLLSQHNIPALGLGVVRDGVVQQTRVFGEKTEGHPADQNTLFKVASLTKPIVALLTLTLVEKGLWDLDEPLQNHHIDPDVADHRLLGLLTTRHVLCHQTGFPNWRHLTEAGNLTFDFEPGKDFQYSGEGFEYLRKALESKFGVGLEALAEEHILGPLNMNNTHFYWNENVDEADYAVEHDEKGQPIPFDKHEVPNAAANLLTTVQDYSNFLAHIANGAGLSDSLYQDFITPYSTKKEGVNWGLGCQVLRDLNESGDYALMHGGGDYGLKTLMVVFPHSKDALLIFSNSENGIVLWRKVMEEYFGKTGEEIVLRQLN